MSRIQATFEALRAQGRKALIPYIPCGDPQADTTPAIMQALADGGADFYCRPSCRGQSVKGGVSTVDLPASTQGVAR